MSRLAIGVVAGLILSGCGGGGGAGMGAKNQPSGMGLPPDAYDLQKAMMTYEASGSNTATVTLSGTVTISGSSYSFTGSGTWSSGASSRGTFNGAPALLQPTAISGTIVAAGRSSPFSSSVVSAYDLSGDILGQSSKGEFDVASAPIMIPSMVGTTPMILGTVSRYSDSTLSVSLGTTKISVAVRFIPIDPASPEVVQFTFDSYDMSGMLVETDTRSFYLSDNNMMSFYAATASNASGSLSVALH